MAIFDTSRTTYGSAASAGHFSTFFHRAIAAVVAWNDARVTRNALAGLTDRELEDIGLSRADIDLVAAQQAAR